MSYKYDLAISFAGEQRPLASELAYRLDASGYSIFYDEFQQAELWGRDLSVELGKVYSQEAHYCLIVVSREYVEKPWTNHERQSAISQFIKRRSDYILCLKVDDVDLPGFPSINGYISLDRYDIEQVYKLLLQKLGLPDHENQVSHLSGDDRAIASQVIAACFRRAVYTRMNSEIDMRSMYDSIGNALGEVQRLTPGIRNQALQLACNEIIQALDDIERAKVYSDAHISVQVPPQIRERIDISKQEVVRLLLEIRRAAKLPMQLPFAIQTDHFFGPEAANEKPRVVA